MPDSPTPLVAVIMGSSSDWETMKHAVDVLERFGVAARAAHRVRASHAGVDGRVRLVRLNRAALK
jgi:5-(carboxyamino)imidazole ribonucleotide mutase